MNANEKKWYKTRLKAALENGTEVLENMRDTFRRAAEEMDRYLRDYQRAVEGKESMAAPEDVLSWAVNHAASNVLGGCRLDLAVDTAAKIADARAHIEE